jgi:hypothetical protein
MSVFEPEGATGFAPEVGVVMDLERALHDKFSLIIENNFLRDQNRLMRCALLQEEKNANSCVGRYQIVMPRVDKLPTHYIINKKATILFWSENDTNDKTVVRRTKSDKHNARLAFLTAYFQKHSGLSKCKANQYLAGLKEVE